MEYSSMQPASPLRELTCHTGVGPYLPHGRGDIPAPNTANQDWYLI